MSDADSLLMDTPPKAKKTAAPKRAGSKPLADVENESHGGDVPSESKNGDASEKYQKVSRAAVASTISRPSADSNYHHSLPNLNISSNVPIHTSVRPNVPPSKCGFTTQ
jgi:hypothetical protein